MNEQARVSISVFSPLFTLSLVAHQRVGLSSSHLLPFLLQNRLVSHVASFPAAFSPLLCLLAEITFIWCDIHFLLLPLDLSFIELLCQKEDLYPFLIPPWLRPDP